MLQQHQHQCKGKLGPLQSLGFQKLFSFLQFPSPFMNSAKISFNCPPLQDKTCVFKKGVNNLVGILTFFCLLERPDCLTTFITSQQSLTVVTVSLIKDTNFHSFSPQMMLYTAIVLYMHQINHCLCPLVEIAMQSLTFIYLNKRSPISVSINSGITSNLWAKLVF